MHTCYVELEKSRYPIYIGTDLLTRPELFANYLHGRQVLIVSNTTVASLYLEKLTHNFQNVQCDTLILPDGEQYKNLQTVERIFAELITHKHTRTTTLLALGGGVVGDMTGFAAACYMRGVDYIQLPTTLLAQVDAAIGGKTAVNHPQGKNLIGAFHQPRCVVVDINTLQTLPMREYRSGLAEVIKYGLLQDAEFFTWLEQHMPALLNKDAAHLNQAILRCAQIKANIVAADEHETSHVRALLNLGHTFAHAIETGTGYSSWLHGEAVAVGVLLAADLSARMGWLTANDVARTQALLVSAGLPVRLPKELTPTRLLELMLGDKKNINSKLRLVLLKTIGQAVVTEDVPQDKLQQTLMAYWGEGELAHSA